MSPLRMDRIAGDFSAAWRAVRRAKPTSLLVVVTLALGIAANVTLFAYFAATRWDPLEAIDTATLVHLRSGTEQEPETAPSYADWQTYREAPAFTQAVAARLLALGVATQERSSFEWSWLVSGEYFSLLTAQPALGRWLGPEDDRPEAPPVVVVSHAFWRRQLGGDPGAVGRTLLLEGSRPFTLVGVAPAGFQAYGLPMSLYVPISQGLVFTKGLNAQGVQLSLSMARLAPGTSAAQAAATVAGVARGLDQENPREEPRLATVTPVGQPAEAADFTLRAGLLLGVVALFLLLASANAANLQLSRLLAREKELAVLSALGADRWRLARRLGAELLLLSGFAGVLGLTLGALGIRSIESLLRVLPAGFGNWAEEGRALVFDGRVALFGVAAVVVSALLAGSAPFLTLLGTDLGKALKAHAGGLGGGRSRIRRLLVAAQTGLSVMLLTGAALLAGTLASLRKVDPGFDPQPLLVASFYLVEAPGRAPAAVRPERALNAAALVERVRALPGVESAGLVARPPLFGGSVAEPILLPGRSEPLTLDANVIGPGYRQSLGLALLAGRDLEDSDRLGSTPVALVNRSFAETYFPKGPLGERLELVGGPRIEDRGSYQVVGVVADSRFQDVRTPARPLVYFAAAQRPWNRLGIAVRSRGSSAAALVPAVHDAIARFGPEVAVVDVLPLPETIERSLFEERLGARVVTVVGLLGLLLAAGGTFSVTSYAVGRRLREMALRMALGASRQDTLRLVLKETAFTVGTGLAVGIAGALALGRLLQSMLYGVAASEPWALLGAPAILALITLAAAYAPARRAARVDPAAMLKRE